jgi:hypothetical protein
VLKNIANTYIHAILMLSPVVCFQFEAFIQFFLGTYDTDMNYIDDFAKIVKKNLSSLTGFWFDCVTSIPWSCFDLIQYMVDSFLSERPETCAWLRFLFLLQQCSNDEASPVSLGTSSANDNARAIRVAKIFRILRVIRVLKLVKFVT